jgi:hypothetical protein
MFITGVPVLVCTVPPELRIVPFNTPVPVMVMFPVPNAIDFAKFPEESNAGTVKTLLFRSNVPRVSMRVLLPDERVSASASCHVAPVELKVMGDKMLTPFVVIVLVTAVELKVMRPL